MSAHVTRTAPECWLTPRPLDASDVQALVVYSSGEACGYGSRAGGRPRPDSDLDLLVIGREASIAPERQLPLWQALRSALGDVGVPVDLLVYGQQQAAKLGGSRWHVLGHAARHGRVLYVAE